MKVLRVHEVLYKECMAKDLENYMQAQTVSNTILHKKKESFKCMEYI